MIIQDQLEQKYVLPFQQETGVTLTDGEIAIGQSVSQSDDVSFNKLILTSDLSGVDASFNNAFIGSLTSDSITVTNLNLGGADLQTTLDTKQDKLTDGLLAGNNVIMDPASANDGDIARFKPDGLFGVSIGDLSIELGIPSKQDTITSSTNLTINDISANDASFNNVKATKFIGNLTGTVSGDVTGNSGTVSIISNHSIDGLSDIDTTGKINGGVLKYNSTSTKWEVGTDISGSSSGIALTDLSVTTATASSTPALSYDNQNGQFTYTPPSIPDITTKQNTITSSTDLVLNDISANDISANNINANDISANDASFNNVKATKFIGDLSGNINGSSATVTSISTHSISNLSDISLNSSELFDGGVLKYNATSQLWKIAVDSLSSDGSGIALTSLSVQQAASSSTPSLTYNNQNGIFTYTPPSIPDITTKQNTLTTSTNITVNDISANDISANDISANDVSFNNVKANQISAFRMNGHIIPTSNANFDLGNAEYKIRHLFLSDNSLWIGDDHKIDISGGELRFKKRNKKRVPKAIIDSGIDVNTAINGVETLVGKSGIENFTLDDWYKWARQSNDFINNAAGGNGDVNNVTIDKIFQDDSNFIASGNDNKKNLNRLRNRVITVTVKSKTSNHPHHGQGSGQAYYFDDVESPIMEFIPGVKYIFNQEDSTNGGHPLRFYKNPDKSGGVYDFNVTITGTPGNDGAKTIIDVSENTLSKIFYQCESQQYMGNVAFVKNSKNIRDISGNNAEFANLKLTSIDIPDNKIQQSKIAGLLAKIAEIEGRLSALEG